MTEATRAISETLGQRVLRQWLESEHGDEDVDDDGGTIRDWFDYADVSRQDLERRIDLALADCLGGYVACAGCGMRNYATDDFNWNCPDYPRCAEVVSHD